MTHNQDLFDILYQGQALTRAQTTQLFSALVNGELSDIQIAGLLIALKRKGETLDEICGAADALLAAAKSFPVSGEGVIDIVGTGGDGQHTINISTTAAFVAAAAGARVAKHGNRGVSSKSGSSDLLSHLGIELHHTPQDNAALLTQHRLCFLFAPHYHGGVKYAAPARQGLKTRTIFNILGPLINPIRPDFMLLGVYSTELIMPIAQALQMLGVKRAMVVHGSGLDEIALHGTTHVAEINNETIKEYQLTPADFNVPPADIDELKGGEPHENAEITKQIFAGGGTQAQRNAVAINAAAALYISGISDNLIDATQLALATLNSGNTMKLLNNMATA